MIILDAGTVTITTTVVTDLATGEKISIEVALLGYARAAPVALSIEE